MYLVALLLHLYCSVDRAPKIFKGVIFMNDKLGKKALNCVGRFSRAWLNIGVLAGCGMLIAVPAVAQTAAKGATAQSGRAPVKVGQASLGRPTLDEVFSEICKADIRHPEVVMSQVQLETGYLTAPMLMSRNNLFGFRAKSYLTFSHWKESIAYYKKWQDKRYTNNSEDYYKFLVRIRYAGHDYKKHVMRFKWQKSCTQMT